MKWVVAVLLAINLGVGAFFLLKDRGLGGNENNAALNVDGLSLRSANRAEMPPTIPPPAASRGDVPEPLCVEWRGLAPEDFKRAREQLKALAGERVMSFTEVPLNTRRWVIFPPLPSAQSAMAKLAELTAAGVQDAFAVKDGAWRNAISLGLYANDQAAGRRVRELEEKGVLGTRVEVLPRQGTEFYFVIRSEDPEALKGLSTIKQSYPNSQQSRVACPA